MPTPEVENTTKTDYICIGCGACCAPGILGQRTSPYLEITPNDLKEDFKSTHKLVAKDQMFGDPREGAKLFLPVVRAQNDFTQCEHLAGIVLEDAKCSCYASRPTACRIFTPGGDACQKLRQTWLVHKDKVTWERKAHPEFSHDEAAHAVVARHNPLDKYDPVLDSLGCGPDYVHLRKLRDEAVAIEKSPEKLLVAESEHKQMVPTFRQQHIQVERKGLKPGKPLAKAKARAR